jgi:riboflavin kinase/FMN adenylyltransferase
MVKAQRKGGRVAAIGNFDGVHRGHQELLRKTIGFARKLGGIPAAVVFDPHPRRYFRPDDPPFLLTTPSRRAALLRDCGMREVIALTFDAALASMTPQAFVKEVLGEWLNLAGVVIGTEFRFGKGRSGDAEGMKALCAEAGVETLLVTPAPTGAPSDKVSSSDIRGALKDGDVRTAAEMLGRPWSVEGEVIAGQRLGRTLGFPTANMTLGELVEPRHGVYAVDAVIDGAPMPAVANFGRKPTVGAPAPLLETYIFRFDGDLYGKKIAIEFIDFIRDERKFDGIEALKAQIAADCEAARHLLSHRR